MPRFHLPSIEEDQLKRWEEERIFAKVLAKDSPKGDFVFFEGPPTANGKPGIHHILTRAFKDVILRFRTMQGFRIDRKAGWDTHGLPVELEVEKRLGFTKKQDIEEYGIAKFNAECKKSVWTYLDLWQKMTRRIGFWVDMEHPYVTYENGFVESLWWVLKEIDKRGLLYKGFRVTPHCPRCVTSLSSHELAQGYKDAEDPSVFVRFRLKGEKGKSLFVWTTTPWTLPANVDVAAGTEVTYVEAKLATGEVLILAKARLSAVEGEYEIVHEFLGSELVGKEYEPLYATMPEDEENRARAYRVYAADFVSTEDGTGLVHIAPAFGEDDARLGESEKLPTLLTVDSTGFVTVEVPGKGKFFKKADADILADLEARGLLYRSGTYVHSYPFCWRCGTPLLYYAKSSWYIRMSGLRQELLDRNAQVNWVPDYIKEGRFGEWLREVKDWALSRERYWGTPLPIWNCGGCKAKRAIGSLKELEELRRPSNLYFLQRHGEAETNATDTLSSWPEVREFHLTEKGRAQVRESALKLKEKGVDLIFSSDLLRTKETAAIISETTGVPVVFDERLRELGLGELNGRPEAEYKAAIKGGDKVTRFDDAPKGTELLRDCRKRIIAFVKEIERKYAGKKIVIVSHGDPLWLLMTGFAGLTDRESVESPLYNHVGEFFEFTVANLPHDEQGHLDVHRPYIDEVILKCPDCGGEMKRVPDVVDVWFDSGAMPFAQWHYPFEEAARIDEGRNFPADFISEAIDQTRGWFYTLLAVSTLLGKKTPPFKNVICLGHVLDSKGQKMSKSKGNVVDPFAAIDKFGADAVRFYFFGVNQPGDPKRFDEKAVSEVVNKVFLLLWNVYTFWRMYAGEGKGAPAATPQSGNMLDRWLLAELDALTAKVTKGMEAYDVVGPTRALSDFINDLSTWFVRRSRDRFKEGGDAAAEAVSTLGYALSVLAKLLAPFAPFIADALYRELGGQRESVHLDVWPTAVGLADESLSGKMAAVRQAAASGLEKRAAAGLPVRQALAKAIVSSAAEFEEWMRGIVAEELNVEAVEWKKSADSNLSVELDTVLTPELKRKGAARELVRHINDLRKAAGLSIRDHVTIRHDGGGAFWKQVLAEHGAAVTGGTVADGLSAGRGETIGEKELEAEGEKLWIGIAKT